MFRLNTDLSVTAGFTKKQCELTLTAGTGGMATGGGSGDCGREVTITATPEAHYEFHGLDRRGQRDTESEDGHREFGPERARQLQADPAIDAQPVRLLSELR